MRSAMRNRRIEMGCSQEDIAKLVGISHSFYAKIERGVKKPGVDNAMALAAVLGLPLETLMRKDAPHLVPTVH